MNPGNPSNPNRLNCLIEIKRHLKHIQNEGVTGINFQISGNDQSVKPQMETHSADNSRSKLQAIRSQLGDCKRCHLHEKRNNIVFGEGNESPEIVFVGEGPGRNEDLQGRPFVGRAGKLLDKIIRAANLNRNDVYICNVIKCRPPQNRNPTPEEIAVCSSFLNQQLDVLKPKIICALGNTAAAYIIGKKAPMAALRGRFYDYRGICVRPTYHPAALLRNPQYRRPVWEDIQEIMRYIGRPIKDD